MHREITGLTQTYTKGLMKMFRCLSHQTIGLGCVNCVLNVYQQKGKLMTSFLEVPCYLFWPRLRQFSISDSQIDDPSNQ